MTNEPSDPTPPSESRPARRNILAKLVKLVLALAVVGVIVFAAVSFAEHSSQGDSADSNAAVAPVNITLTPEQLKRIHLQTVEPSTFHKSVEVTGTVDFDYDQATTVLAPFGGPVSRLLVALGEQVKADQPLASVDSPDFAATISAYRKAIDTARINRQIADLDKQLLQHRAIAQRDADQAELNASTAEADRQAALAALVSLKVDPQTIQALQQGRPYPQAPGMIRSPVAGTVVEKLITPGQLLTAGTTPCFTVADLSRVWVMAHLFGADLGSISPGDHAQVLTGIRSQSFAGKVDNISALMDPDTRSVAVRVLADNPDKALKKGMYVRVRIDSSRQSSGLLLPVSAVLRDEQNLPFVYVALGDGHFARRPVTLGYRVGDRYDITAGIVKGDQVVIEGGLFVQFMENQ